MAAHAAPTTSPEPARWWQRWTRHRGRRQAGAPLPPGPPAPRGRHHAPAPDPDLTLPMALPEIATRRRVHPYRPAAESPLVRAAYDTLDRARRMEDQ